MKNLYCVICSKYRKFEKLKISYLLEKTLVLSITCNKCKKIQLRYKKLLFWLEIYNYSKNMAEENTSQEVRLKNIDEKKINSLKK